MWFENRLKTDATEIVQSQRPPAVEMPMDRAYNMYVLVCTELLSVGYFYERTLFEADDQCPKASVGSQLSFWMKKTCPPQKWDRPKILRLAWWTKLSSSESMLNFRLELPRQTMAERRRLKDSRARSSRFRVDRRPIRSWDIRCTRENEHPRKRAPVHTTPAYSDTEAKFSSQTQPRKCAPTANLDTQLTAFCTRSTFCTRWSNLLLSFDCKSGWFWGFCTLPDQSLPRHKTSVFAHSSFSSCSLFEFSPFQRNAHNFAV